MVAHMGRPLYIAAVVTIFFFLVMAALCNMAGHYIFILWFLSIYLSPSIFFLA